MLHVFLVGFSAEKNFFGSATLAVGLNGVDVDLLTAQLLSPHTAGDEQGILIDGANMSAESEMNSLCPRPRVRH